MIPAPVLQWFFRPVRATGFGAMRIAWALVTLSTFVPLFIHRDAYFLVDSGASIASIELVGTLLIVGLIATACGVVTRLSMLVSLITLLFFHQQNLFILGGGDTLLRLIGWILLVSPGLTAVSFDRYRVQKQQWMKHNVKPSPLEQPVWPYRLLLWQLIILYGTSLWHKLLGTTWLSGDAVTMALQHPLFSRVSDWDIGVMSVPLSWGVLLFHACWLLLLLPTRWQPRLKRWLLCVGLIFHIGILLFFNVGAFSLAVLTGYIGLLLAEDLSVMQKIMNKKFDQKIIILYDGECSFCRRAVYVLMQMDMLHRTQWLDYHLPDVRRKHAPNISLSQLDEAIHMRFPDGEVRRGFAAFAQLCRHLPPLWMLVPLTFIPGVRELGERVYTRIAGRRTCKIGGKTAIAKKN